MCSGHSFKLSFDQSKKQYFKAFNAIFSKVGRLASEEVVIASYMSLTVLSCSLAMYLFCILFNSQLPVSGEIKMYVCSLVYV